MDRMPFDSRVNNGAKEFGINEEEAKRRVISRENRRSAFIRQSFNADLADPLNYDMVINVQKLNQDSVWLSVEKTLTQNFL